MKTVIIRTMSEKKKPSGQCSHSIIALILESSYGNPELNSPSKRVSDEVLSNAVQISKTSSRDKLPKNNSKNNRQIGSPNVIVSSEKPNNNDIRNTSKKTHTRDFKKVFALGDSMIKHV